MKIIACIFMLIDHIGSVLFPDVIVFRVIGRIAFPLFAFLIAYGAAKTRNIYKYFARLLIFAFISQIAISLTSWNISLYPLNIFFTLAAGVLSIILIRLTIEKKNPLFPVALAVLLISALLIPFDYGIAGILLIVMLWAAPQMTYLTRTASLLVFNVLLTFFGTGNIQWFSIAALLFIFFFKDEHLKIPKWERWAFYVFYPLHLVILHLINLLF